MQSKIPAQEIAKALFELITRAKEEEPILAKRLEALTSFIHACDPGQLHSRKYVLAVFTEICIFAERWLLLKQLSPEKKKQFLENLNPAESYFSEILFPAWLRERNPKLTIWKEKLMEGKLEQATAQFYRKLHGQIQNQGGYSVSPLLIDWWMNTNLIAGFERDKCLCVELTTAGGDDLQARLIEWEKILWHCGIKRGLLLSYNSSEEDEIKLADTILSASKTLEIGQYRTASQDRKKQRKDGLYLN
ncbi:MAG: hypothetical protein WCA07_01025 [Gloeobacterales cyanobacterium]